MADRHRLRLGSALLLLLFGLTPSAGAQSDAIDQLDARIRDVEARVVDVVVPISTGAEITLGADVLFAFGSAELGVPAREQLTGAIERIRSDRPRLVRVEGHTDAIGDAASNQTLSERRAAAVRAALAEQMSDVPVEAVGFGEDRPVAPNELPDGTDNPGGRQQNRRVAIVLVTS